MVKPTNSGMVLLTSLQVGPDEDPTIAKMYGPYSKMVTFLYERNIRKAIDKSTKCLLLALSNVAFCCRRSSAKKDYLID